MRIRAKISLIAVSVLALAASGARDAKACGGCFHENVIASGGNQSFSDITDERMLLSVSPRQTTLYDQIRYTGNPSSFAWVLPIKGSVTVGLSADVVFDTIDALTTTSVTGPTITCPSCGGGGSGFGCGSSASSAFDDTVASDSGAASATNVTVTKAENVGPYETVQLHSNDGTGKALTDWLTTNGFDIPDDVKPTVDAYVSEGFDFLAMRLLPNEGVSAMRPVRVTTDGAALTLPLRMAAVGTGATVGITLWVVSTGRYEPQNFPFFHVEDEDLVWDFDRGGSNYTTLRAQNEATLAGRGWEIESSIDLNDRTITNAILSGGVIPGIQGVTSPVAPAADDYMPIGTPPDDEPDPSPTTDAGADAGDGGDDGGDASATTDAGTASDAGSSDADGGTYESAESVRSDDLAALLEPARNAAVVRVSRMRTDLTHEAMSVDLVLRASADQSELSNQRLATQSLHAPTCASCPDSSSGCNAASATEEERNGLGLTTLGFLGFALAGVARRRRK